MPAAESRSMGSTSGSLLNLARLGDAAAWQKIVELYGPLIYYWCRKSSLPPPDAADVTQDVFRTIAGRLASFEHEAPGSSFRGWLRTITRSRIVDHVRQRDLAVAGGGTTLQVQLQHLPDNASDADDEQPDSPQLRRLHEALEAIQAESSAATWQAFWQTTIEGRSGEEVAVGLSLSRGAVFEAKSRVLRKLRKLLGDDFEPVEK